MPAIDDAKTVIEILAGTLPDNPRLVRIADKFVDYAGTRFTPADPLNPTNEEKAQNFLDELRRFGRRVLRDVAQDDELTTLLADIQSAGDTAEADL